MSRIVIPHLNKSWCVSMLSMYRSKFYNIVAFSYNMLNSDALNIWKIYRYIILHDRFLPFAYIKIRICNEDIIVFKNVSYVNDNYYLLNSDIISLTKNSILRENHSKKGSVKKRKLKGTRVI